MKLETALQAISAPKGLTSIINGILSDDFSVLPHQKGIDAGYEQAKEKVAQHKKRLDECKSDWAYWSILGDLEYWRAIVKILEAGKIAGENELPDVPIPRKEGLVVMDAIYEVTKFGEQVLAKTKEAYPSKEN